MSLIEHLQQVRDFRTQPRYELWVILLLVGMGVLSGCTSYRSPAASGQSAFWLAEGTHLLPRLGRADFRESGVATG